MDIFGGLMKGLSGFMPQDDPNLKIMNAQTELDNLMKEEKEIYAQIGKAAISKYGIGQFSEFESRLTLVQSNIPVAKQKLEAAQEEKRKKEEAEKLAEEMLTCQSCGTRNPEGVKFCQECGKKLGIQRLFCKGCGAENPPGTRFCGECGKRLTEV